MEYLINKVGGNERSQTAESKFAIQKLSTPANPLLKSLEMVLSHA